MTRNFGGIERHDREAVMAAVRKEASTRIAQAGVVFDEIRKLGILPKLGDATSLAEVEMERDVYRRLVDWYLGPASYSLEEVHRQHLTKRATRPQASPPTESGEGERRSS